MPQSHWKGLHKELNLIIKLPLRMPGRQLHFQLWPLFLNMQVLLSGTLFKLLVWKYLLTN